MKVISQKMKVIDKGLVCVVEILHLEDVLLLLKNIYKQQQQQQQQQQRE